MRTLLRVVVALAAGVLLTVAFEPVGQPVAAAVAIGILLRSLRGRGLREAALLGAAFGVGFMSVLLRWLGPSIGPDAWWALSVAEAGWFALAAVGLRLVSRLPGWPLWTAAVWTAVEVLRAAWPFGGFPWGRVGHGVVSSPWESALPYVGVTGASYVVVLLAGLALWAWDRAESPAVVVFVAAVGLSLLPAALPFQPESSGSLTVAVVQGGVPGAGNEVAANAAQVTRNHVEATQRLAADVASGAQPRPDLVVWPENATASDPFGEDDVAEGIAAATNALGDTPLLVGALVDAPRPENVLNQGVLWAQDGPTTSRYTKHHPVPFGEYIPFRSVLGPLTGREEQVPRDMLPGTGSTPLVVGQVPIANAICFDIAYDDVLGPQVRAGAEVGVVQTSNSSFIGTSQLAQQFGITQARALETGRSIVVASLNGISGVVGADGRVQVRAPLRGTEVFVAEVSLSKDLTPAVRAGALPSYAMVLVAGLALVVSARRGPVSRRRVGPGPDAG